MGDNYQYNTDHHGGDAPYDLNRTNNSSEFYLHPSSSGITDTFDYSGDVDSETYIDIRAATNQLVGNGNLSAITDQYGNRTFDNSSLGGANSYGFQQDATETVREMHLALLYMLSNPEEFQKALQLRPAQGTTTMAEWNAEYETESILTETEVATTTLGELNSNNLQRNNGYSNGNNHLHNDESSNNDNINYNDPSSTPLPFIVFADDAEVVLPQAHTASQLFGLERIEGIELEAAAGITALSQLFLRWLALMPGGDHLNIIDPPGLTIMKISGGRYRVTAAHRVIWTWMNEFAAFFDPPMSESQTSNQVISDSSQRGQQQTQDNTQTVDGIDTLQIGDLVTMTIVDVFETDNYGKLLSYCPTFDNRSVSKTNPNIEKIRKSSTKIMQIINKVQRSNAARLVYSNISNVAQTVKQKVVENYYSPTKKTGSRSDTGGSAVTDAEGFEKALEAAEEAAIMMKRSAPVDHPEETHVEGTEAPKEQIQQHQTSLVGDSDNTLVSPRGSQYLSSSNDDGEEEENHENEI